MRFLLWGGWLSALLCCGAWADSASENATDQSNDTPALFNMSFEELMSQEVTVASRSAESLDSAPSTVTLFTRDHIKHLGVENVYDLLNYVPGFQVTRGDWVGAVPKEHARGVFLDNGYVLFLINGVRINELSFGKASVYSPFIPLSLVERVEVIRGPGSALYGSNAFMGVVNIVTLSGVDEINLGIGEHGRHKLSGTLSQKGEDWQLDWLFDWRQSDGERYRYLQQEVRDPFQHGFFNLAWQYQDWQGSLRYYQSQLDEFINLGGASAGNQYQSRNQGISVGRDWQIDSQSELSLNLNYLRHEIESAGRIIDADTVDFISNDFFVGPYWVTEDVEVTLDYATELTSSLSLNAGGSLRDAEQSQAGTVTSHLSADGRELLLTDEGFLGAVRAFADQGPNARSALLSSQEYQSAYLQFKWQIEDRVQLFWGGRYDNVKEIGSNLSPRLALVYQANDTHTLRVQYGEAFRTPVTNELFSEDSVTVGNPNLKPEQIKTLELLWRYRTDRSQWEVVLFNNQLGDFVNREPLLNSASQFTFANTVKRHISGLEMSVRAHPSENSEWFANYTQIFDQPLAVSYRSFANLGWQQHWRQFRLNVDTLWRSHVEVPAQFSSGSYSLWNIKLQYALTNELELSLSGLNLFDRDYVVYEPRLSNFAIPGTRRQTWLNLRYQY